MAGRSIVPRRGRAVRLASPAGGLDSPHSSKVGIKWYEPLKVENTACCPMNEAGPKKLIGSGAWREIGKPAHDRPLMRLISTPREALLGTFQ